jgi:N utilization substance protein B
MPKKLTQHEIRQRAVETLFVYETQAEYNDRLFNNFQENIKLVETRLNKPMRFFVRFQNEHMVIRDFPEAFTTALGKLQANLAQLGLETRSVPLALAFIRDFGSFAKKLQDFESSELSKIIFDNLNLIRILQIELEEGENTVLFLDLARSFAKTPKASNADKLKVFKTYYAKRIHASILDKFDENIFQPLTLQKELAEKLEFVKSKMQVGNEKTLVESISFALNYDNEEEETQPVPEFFTALVTGTLEKKSQLSALLSEYLAKSWSLGRLTRIERAILFLGAYEILFAENTPDLVALDEAIQLAKDFSDEKSSKFINGVLTHLIKE